jgi:[ribosomal protein S5]-alanine N-acetyltransferase
MEKNSLKEFPVLETNRLLLRKLSVDDAEDIFEYASDPDVNTFMPWDIHKSIDDTREFLEKSEENSETTGDIDWGIELKNEKILVGGITVRKWNDANRCGDIGYVLSKRYWNKGIATEALRTVILFGFEKLCLNRIEAHCDENNIASYKVMEKAGMKYEGTLREKVFVKNKFVNMKVYSILKDEYFENLKKD